MSEFLIIGGDGKEYGPISTEGVNSWIQEGRANGDSQIKKVEAEEWERLRDFQEFAGALSPAISPSPIGQVPQQPVPGQFPHQPAPRQFPHQKPGKIQAIAIITLVQGIMAIIGALIWALSTLCLWVPFIYGLVYGIMATIKGSTMLGQNPWPAYQTVRTTAIMGIVNVINCDFMFGMTGGIVILVFLNDPEVKAYIYSKGRQI